MVREGRFAAINVSGEPWLEIDFPKDIRRARDEILPRLESLETGE
jgi:choline kinase